MFILEKYKIKGSQRRGPQAPSSKSYQFHFLSSYAFQYFYKCLRSFSTQNLRVHVIVTSNKFDGYPISPYPPPIPPRPCHVSSHIFSILGELAIFRDYAMTQRQFTFFRALLAFLSLRVSDGLRKEIMFCRKCSFIQLHLSLFVWNKCVVFYGAGNCICFSESSFQCFGHLYVIFLRNEKNYCFLLMIISAFE